MILNAVDVRKSSYYYSPVYYYSYYGEKKRKSGKRGKGLAAMIKGTATPTESSCFIKVNPDGSITLLSSTVEIGVATNRPAFWSQALASQFAASAAGSEPPITNPKKRGPAVATVAGEPTR